MQVDHKYYLMIKDKYEEMVVTMIKAGVVEYEPLRFLENILLRFEQGRVYVICMNSFRTTLHQISIEKK